jgi:hypothetical protein
MSRENIGKVEKKYSGLAFKRTVKNARIKRNTE